jgi:hypothetical protein
MPRWERPSGLVENPTPGDIREWLPHALTRPGERVRLTQRVVLEIRGVEQDMTGYLELRSDGSWRALALGDMGIALFHLAGDAEGARIVSAPEGFPTRPLLEGVAGDIVHVFGTKRPERVLETAAAKVLDCGGGRFEEYELTGDGGLLVRSREILGGRVVRLVEYGAPSGKGALPQETRVTNYRWRYRLNVRLLNVTRWRGPKAHGEQ